MNFLYKFSNWQGISSTIEEKALLWEIGDLGSIFTSVIILYFLSLLGKGGHEMDDDSNTIHNKRLFIYDMSLYSAELT